MGNMMKTWPRKVECWEPPYAIRLVLAAVLCTVMIVLDGGGAQAAVIDLGAAGLYAGATVNGIEANFNMNKSTVRGDIFVGERNKQTIDLDYNKSRLSGKAYYDNRAVLDIDKLSTIDGTDSLVALTQPQSNQITTDLKAAISGIEGLSATQTSFPEITATNTITRTTNLNVIDVEGDIDLDSGERLTFSGSAGDLFIVRVRGRLKTTGATIDADGVGPGNILFVVTDQDGINSSSDSNFYGTYITTSGEIDVNGGIHYGAFLQAAEDQPLDFDKATVNFAGFQPAPLPASALLLGSGLLGLSLLGWRRRGKD
jgi:hypothetical protein